MQAKPEYRDREETEVAVLDALADRGEDGMTVFELRSSVEVDIDTLESALANLKADDLIEATDDGDGTHIVPDSDVIGPETENEATTIVDRIRDRLPL
ncbi:hypothetical protein HLRTI_003367 [Halorhabdus tiamatea SARL4B]|uniref:MarR family transcriptional regulator n=1 Tax=Halorhabdus tiamatea SARL4B TaxID=1033806 RepID=F7PQN3_9EURY|nr:DUF6432 family protein [Halorhabdus tiamatea]ERJ04680.1 hypothetical protein HLRTI_003367 [Halorhabdus tiamatea SARL4B]CCQ32310.1 conserved hypothetical protein [Halorhabdus tiamatea SARL4B]